MSASPQNFSRMVEENRNLAAKNRLLMAENDKLRVTISSLSKTAKGPDMPSGLAKTDKLQTATSDLQEKTPTKRKD